MKKIFALSLVVLVFASCEKNALPDVQPVAAATEKTAASAAVAASQQSVSWTFEPAVLTYTDCTTNPLRTGCGNYIGGLQAQSSGEYAGSAQIKVQRCDGLAFSKQAAQLEVHADSVCGKLVAQSTIQPNYKVALANFYIGTVVTKTLFYSVVILPGGKKGYSNPIAVTRNN